MTATPPLGTRRSVLIGLGAIGMGLDLQASGPTCRTHARALSLSPEWTIVGGVEPDTRARRTAVETYGWPVFESLQALAESSAPPQLVVIATPTDSHLETVREVLGIWQPELLLLEKPAGSSAHEAQEIVALASKAGSAHFVNYFRKAIPTIRSLREYLRLMPLGRVRAAEARYWPTARSNASHFLDLIEFLTDFQVNGSASIEEKRATARFDSPVPGHEFLAEFAQDDPARCPVRCDSLAFRLDGGSVTVTNETIEVRDTKDALVRRHSIGTEFAQAQCHVLANLTDLVRDSGLSNIRVQAVLDEWEASGHV